MTRSGAFFLRLSAEERAELQRQATVEGRSLADLIRVRCGLPAARVPKPEARKGEEGA